MKMSHIIVQMPHIIRAISVSFNIYPFSRDEEFCTKTTIVIEIRASVQFSSVSKGLIYKE